ncbi:MAG: hypothetical protein HOO93_13645 [Methyloglobulus sp.]|nr:hypothetical protein [Methyloglobulus sp.]
MIFKKFSQLSWFGTVFLGSIGFPLAILISRGFFKNTGLVDLVSLQTDTAFIAFLIQAGIRAGLRKEYLIGHVRLVQLLELYLRGGWAFVFPPVSAVALYFFEGAFLPMIYGLNAVITLLIGLSLVRQDVKRAGGFSIALFAMNFGSGMIVIMAGVSGSDKLAMGITIECLSFLLGILFASNQREVAGHKKSSRLLLAVLRKYLGLQIASFVIMFSAYIFAQLVLSVSNAGDTQLIVLYSDAILISGIITLVLSRILVLYEQNLVKSGKIELYLSLIHLGFFIFTLLVSILRSGLYHEKLMFFLLLMGLMGRFSIALVSGYLDEKWRTEFMCSMSLFAGFQVVIFALLKTEFWQDSYLYYAATINMFVLSFLMILVYRYRGGAYISNRSSASEN